MAPLTETFPSSRRDDIAALADRLRAVERSQGRWRRATIALAVTALGAVLVGMSAPPAKRVDAEVIRVLDSRGKTRMILTADENGPAVALLDEHGRLRANLGVAREGPSLDLLDEKETPRAQLTVDQNSEPHLGFTDAKGGLVTLHP